MFIILKALAAKRPMAFHSSHCEFDIIIICDVLSGNQCHALIIILALPILESRNICHVEKRFRKLKIFFSCLPWRSGVGLRRKVLLLISVLPREFVGLDFSHALSVPRPIVRSGGPPVGLYEFAFRSPLGQHTPNILLGRPRSKDHISGSCTANDTRFHCEPWKGKCAI